MFRLQWCHVLKVIARSISCLFMLLLGEKNMAIGTGAPLQGNSLNKGKLFQLISARKKAEAQQQ